MAIVVTSFAAKAVSRALLSPRAGPLAAWHPAFGQDVWVNGIPANEWIAVHLTRIGGVTATDFYVRGKRLATPPAAKEA